MDPQTISISATIIFLVTYTGIAIGRIPPLVIDRTGMALLGAMAMVALGGLAPESALNAIHFPTLILLYGLMVVSAQLRLGGFYTWLARRVVEWSSEPKRFLLILMVVSGALASVLANDIICLAFTPVLAIALRRRGLNPVPFLIGLAMGTNLGSAATIIGNPQTMYIGQYAALSFRDYLFWCAPPSLAGLLCTYGIILHIYRGRLQMMPSPDDAFSHNPPWPEFDKWQTTKGLFAAGAVVVLMFSPWPREWSVLAVGALLLMSRRMHTRAVLGVVDWHLITLFIGLFIVVRGLTASGVPERIVASLAESGVSLANPYSLSVIAVVISNIVSNVPATVLLIPHMAGATATSWFVLGLATTYAGNLFTIGSMANLIVIEQAKLHGVRITFWEYVRTGAIVTAVNMMILWGWIFLMQ